MDLTDIATGVLWITLIAGPILTFATARRVRHKPRDAQRIAMRSAAVVATVALAMSIGLEAIWRPVNWLALSAAYLCWSSIVGVVFTIKPRVVGILAGIVTSATLLPGLGLATVGFLGLLFIAGDYGRPPSRQERLADGLDCTETDWGAAFSDDGHDIHIYRYWPLFPALRLQVRHIVVDETEPEPGIPATLHCAAPARSGR